MTASNKWVIGVENEKRKIGVFTTEYSLMLYMLWCEDWKETIYIIKGRVGIDILKRMIAVGVQHIYGYRLAKLDALIVSKKQIFLHLKRKISKLIFKRIHLPYLARIAYKNHWGVFGQDHFEYAYLFRKCNFCVVEDGAANYEDKSAIVLEQQKLHQIKDVKYIPFGWDASVKRVLLTGRLPIPAGLRNKVEIHPLIKAWQELDISAQKNIMYILGYPLDKMESLRQDGRDIFLITQNYAPFSCTKEKLVSIYKKILSNYDQNKVIIKPHPGDHVIDFEREFPRCAVMREKFPFEIVFFSGFPVNKIVTIDSTAAFGLWDDSHVDMYREYAAMMR